MTTAILDRYAYLHNGTAGVLTVAGQSFATVEKPWINNEQFRSCIPEGTYTVKKYNSPRFPDTWEIQDVEGRSHILIHAGNSPKDVEGCIAVGMAEGDRDPLWVVSSQAAMNELRKILPDEFDLIIRPYSTKHKRGYL